MADLIILAEKAQKVTVRKKNRPRPSGTYQRIFFAEMGAVTGYDGLYPRAAISFLVNTPVHPAFTRTKAAGF
jgi:hypothetical protein